jgi:uncharacterized delta-60 repeat protein
MHSFDPQFFLQRRAPRMTLLPILGFLVLTLFSLRVRGAAGDVDLSFDPGSGINGTVNSLALQPDGRLIIGGTFSAVKGLQRSGIARLNADGSGDGSFNPASANARVLALQPDGKVIAGNGDGIFRLNANGSLDTGFPIARVTDYDLFPITPVAMALQPDGKVLFGGGFRLVNGVQRSGIARLNANGSLDATFVPETVDAFFTSVYSIAVQPDGKVLVAGQQLTVGDARIIRLNADGSLDDSFAADAEDTVWAVALQPDGTVLIGGQFGSVNNQYRPGIARLTGQGATDATFVPGTAAGIIQSIAVQKDGKVIIGRYSTASTGSKLARLNADGSVDGDFNYGVDFRPAVYAIAVQADGKIIASGGDLDGDRKIMNYDLLVRFHADRSRDGAFVAGGGIEGGISTLASQPDSKVLIAGNFFAIDGKRYNGLARLNADGSLDSSFAPGPGIPEYKLRILLQPDGKLLVGGYSPVIDPEGFVTGRDEIVRLNANGSVDGDFAAGTGMIVGHRLIARQADGRLIGSGWKTVDGIDRKTFVRFNPDGSTDPAFSFMMGSPDDLSGIAIQPDGKLLVAGRFRVGADLKIYALARLNANGSLDNGFSHTQGEDTGGYHFLNDVLALPDGKIIISGMPFGNPNGVRAIARLKSDGTVDGTFQLEPTELGLGTISGAMASQPDGKVLLSGSFRLSDEEAATGVFRLNANGTLDRTYNLGGGYNPGANIVRVQPDGNILVAGEFVTFNGVGFRSVARLSGDPRMPVPFTAWAASFGLSGTTATADADPDKDGLPNATEYVLGGNPAAPAASGRPAAKLIGNNLIFIFPRDDASETSGITLTVESGANLETWPSVFTIGPDTITSSPGVSISENGSGPDIVTVTIPRAGTDRIFARLKVTIVP